MRAVWPEEEAGATGATGMSSILGSKMMLLLFVVILCLN